MNSEIRKKMEADKKTCESAIEIAYNMTPEKYHGFIYLIEQSKNYAPKGWEAVWGKIVKPYMSVDGRVLIAREEHTKAGKTMNINQPTFDFDKMICQTKIDSEIRGSSYGTIEIGSTLKNGKWIPKIADSETSAIGRALGFLGYGLLPSGIASADEMFSFISSLPEDKKKNWNIVNKKTQNPAEKESSASGGKVITEKQRKRMFAKAGGDKDIIDFVIAKHGFESSKDITMGQKYDAICAELDEIKTSKQEQQQDLSVAKHIVVGDDFCGEEVPNFERFKDYSSEPPPGR